jgi:hypothetical protein
MYLGTTSLTKLAAFLRGFDYAVRKQGVEENDRFLAEFRDWVHQRFQSNRQSWEETILLHSADEFLKESQNGLASPCVRAGGGDDIR